MWWSDHWWMSGGWPAPFMFFGPALFVVFLIVCVVMMVFMMRGGMRRHSSDSHAIEILKERYARGEINQAEYEERRRFLQA